MCPLVAHQFHSIELLPRVTQLSYILPIRIKQDLQESLQNMHVVGHWWEERSLKKISQCFTIFVVRVHVLHSLRDHCYVTGNYLLTSEETDYVYLTPVYT